MYRALLMLTLLSLTALSAPASAHTNLCDQLAAAPKADMKAPEVKRALEVWRRVLTPFEAMQQRQTALVILDAKARAGEGDDAPAFKPTGHICPGAPPVIYVTWPLIELVYTHKRYPEDFLAFVLGHELGHRVNDLSGRGDSILGVAERPGQGRHEESLADKRAAFYATLGDYSMRALAREDIVATFLDQEVQVRRYAIEERKQALLETLHRFDAYEQLYQASIALAMGAEGESAERLIAHVDELITGQSAPLPELRLVHALVLLNNAAPDAPWTAHFGDLPPLRALRCGAVFPSSSALAETPPVQGAVRGALDEQERAARAIARLDRAERLLQDAQDFGADRMAIHSARACLALYRGEADKVYGELELTNKSASRAVPEGVTKTLSANRALASMLNALKKSPPPSDMSKRRAWHKQLEKTLKKPAKDNPQLSAALTAVGALARGEVVARAPNPHASCSARPEAARPTPMPQADGPLGACPAGWTLTHSSPEVDPAHPTAHGITLCASGAQVGAGKLLVRVNLPGAMSPALPPLAMTLLLEDTPPQAPLPLKAWACGCPLVEARGVSDRGESMTQAVCPAVSQETLLFQEGAGGVRRVITIREER